MTTPDVPEERHFSLPDATRRIQAAYDALGIRYATSVIGQDPCAALTELHDADGTLLTGGWGKGAREAAVVGSLYEAMEHLLMDRHAAHDAQVRAVEDLIALLDPDLTRYLPGALLFDQIEETIATRRYTGLAGATDFHYPVALSAPTYADAPLPVDTFDYAPLRRYASNSGTAIGGSLEEALLHALNECAERDAISLFLLSHFFHAGNEALRVVSPAGLPADVADLYRQVSQCVDADICLLDISSTPGITSCLAVAHLCYDHARPYGAGASLNPAHAARRALHELLQSHLALASDATPVRAGRAASVHPAQLLQQWPRLQPSARMDIEDRLASQPIVAVRLEDRPAGPVASQIQQISQALQADGLVAGYNVIHTFDNGITLVNAVVPRFERFYLVTLGHVVVPGRRGGAPGASGER
ncbi:hypothetical protein ABB28_09045 [Stenotrophomonas chelatiphaga]|uniref:YcaO domain-containing protein n=1 Tax=Stenotrophomonas chelatiphaga TaxID=517011 RepID=A0A0R0CVH3_9GAMM|nr:YcaO-like family protein [Stenotrophomonas chelatiphaga]KRG73849.1 hypothetical protein ABB28_09045 [Stenotrophomonas chelatiphaga]